MNREKNIGFAQTTLFGPISAGHIHSDLHPGSAVNLGRRKGNGRRLGGGWLGAAEYI